MVDTYLQGDSIVISFSNSPISESPIWRFSNHQLQFFRLEANQELQVLPGSYLKVIEGALSDPLRLPFPAPFEKSSTILEQDIVVAGTDSVFLLITPPENLHPISNPSQVQFEGNFESILKWEAVENLDWGSAFAGLEFYNLRGWNLKYMDRHIAYIQAWLAGTGVNCGNHDHSEQGPDTFREIHLAITNGTGEGGMVWFDQEGVENEMALEAGEEHGPFWRWSDDLSRVVYPTHRWEAGPAAEQEAFDFWFAVELPALRNS